MRDDELRDAGDRLSAAVRRVGRMNAFIERRLGEGEQLYDKLVKSAASRDAENAPDGKALENLRNNLVECRAEHARLRRTFAPLLRSESTAMVAGGDALDAAVERLEAVVTDAEKLVLFVAGLRDHLARDAERVEGAPADSLGTIGPRPSDDEPSVETERAWLDARFGDADDARILGFPRVAVGGSGDLELPWAQSAADGGFQFPPRPPAVQLGAGSGDDSDPAPRPSLAGGGECGVELHASRTVVRKGSRITIVAVPFGRGRNPRYDWTWTGGTLIGKGDTVQWAAPTDDADERSYDITVTYTADPKCRATATATISVITEVERGDPAMLVLEGAEQVFMRFKRNLDERLRDISEAARGGERGEGPAGVTRITFAQRGQAVASELVPDAVLWACIRRASDALSFTGIQPFVDAELRNPARKGDFTFYGVGSYELLRQRVQGAVLANSAGVVDSGAIVSEIQRLRGRAGVSAADITRVVNAHFDASIRPFLDRPNLFPSMIEDARRIGFDNDACTGVIRRRIERPLFVELIWSYYHELGMLVQAMSAIALRFQNKDLGRGRNALAQLELSPLRPLNNLLWGWVETSDQRLTVNRRVHEYEHHYGISLEGRAVGQLRPVERRSQFLESFHGLLRQATIFFRELDDNTVTPDAFPLLNALREVQLQLREGMHNQYGDLPWASRVEMLMQQVILARPEFERFLGTREMLPYPERWMGHVDTVKQLMDWTTVSITEFNRLARWGEQLLLSIRFGMWANPATPPASAFAWAVQWRADIQGYVHTFRTITGVDLTAELAASGRIDALSPSLHVMRRHREAQRAGAR